MRNHRQGCRFVAVFLAATLLPISSAWADDDDRDDRYGGRAVLGEDHFPETLNPFAPGGDNFVVTILYQLWGVGVQDIDGDLEFFPSVVRELPTVANGLVVVNDDGTMTVTYRIRREARWEDGRRITGHDFAFTLETILNPAYELETGVYEDIVSYEARRNRFSYTLSAPTLNYELIFGSIIPKHQVEGTDFLNDWNDRTWLSGGPFRLVELSDAYALFERNPRYWGRAENGDALPYLDEVIVRFDDFGALVEQFVAGEIDVINAPPDPALVEILGSGGAQVDTGAGPIWEHLNFQFDPARRESERLNITEYDEFGCPVAVDEENPLPPRNRDSLNAHLAFRQAIAHAIDRERIARELTNGQVVAMQSYVEAFTPGLSGAEWAQYDYNPGRARELLEGLVAELGLEGPPTVYFSTTVESGARVQLDKLLEEMLEAVGIAYVSDLEPACVFFGLTLDFADWDLGEWAWVGSPGLTGLVSIHDVFDPNSPPPEGSNYYRWGTLGSDVVDDATRRFAELVEAMNATIDEGTLVTLIGEAAAILADYAVMIPLYQRPFVQAYYPERVQGPVLNASQAGYTWNIEEWWQPGAGDDDDSSDDDSDDDDSSDDD